ncbi:MAG: 3-deoxy-7-phosphoheptulonate synthase [Verrucomicrobiae bacterium]|nr:3-deoxy-7-phosphoheptulonate synthase [Verrucomicrobiae bacterium]
MSVSSQTHTTPQQIHNIRVREIVRISSPQALTLEEPMTPECLDTVMRGREEVARILKGEDSRLLVIVGPCSIHDPVSALEYARRLNALRLELSAKILPIMRVYFEKPRTTTGWKGLVNDPDMNDSCDIEKGLRTARHLLKTVTAMGLPTASEFLDAITPQYFGDFVSWAAIGARTTESQSHREMASGLSMPVGFKNGTDGNLQVALDAMKASRNPHSFLGMNEQGQISLIRSLGNPLAHPILRGGNSRENFDPESVRDARERLVKAGLPPFLMIDCSHGNSRKLHDRQEIAWKSLVEQRKNGDTSIIGAMLESHLHEGSQSIPQDLSQLRYGVSVTDACIGWEKTEELLRHAAE